VIVWIILTIIFKEFKLQKKKVLQMNEETKGLIAYCGLYCGDCIGYRQKAADLARDLRKELRKTKFEKTA